MSRTNPRVTVGLPVYNGENYVNEAITSIIQQSYEDFELVICDNHSTDQTEAICRDWAARDRRIRYHRNPYNLGSSPNQNLVFHLANGQFFMWLMHDDRHAPTSLERCVNALENHPEVIAAYPRMIDIDGSSNVIGPHEEDLHLMQERPAQRLSECLLRAIICNAALGLIRTDALRKTSLVGPYRGSDHVLLAELAMLGKIYELEDYLYFRRVHSGSSLLANRDPKTLSLWFDTRNRGSSKHFKLRLFREFICAIHRLELAPRDKTRCYLALRHWIWNQCRGWAWPHKQRLREWLERPGPSAPAPTAARIRPIHAQPLDDRRSEP